MIFVASEGAPKFNSTPLASITCGDAKVVLEADDEDEARIRATFFPYQAMKIITADCYNFTAKMPDSGRSVLKIQSGLQSLIGL